MSPGEWVGLTCTLLALLVLWLYRNTPADTDVWPHGDPAADDDHPHPDDKQKARRIRREEVDSE